jgi:hypothetical protein
VNLRRLLPLVFTLIATAALAQPKAQTNDPGDPPSLKRYEGSVIFAHTYEKFARYPLLLSKWQPPAEGQSMADAYAKKQVVEGPLTRLYYVITDPERTLLEVFRNYQNELKAGGWTELFAGLGSEELHGNFGYQTRQREPVPDSQIMEYPHMEDTAYIAASRGETTFVAISMTRYNNGLVGPYEKAVPLNSLIVRVDLIQPEQMEQRMVFVDAAQMKSEISAQGRIALYGIQFDFNKADLKEESTPTLRKSPRSSATTPP